MDDLIYDRTQEDVDRAIELNDKYSRGTITAQELVEWDNGLKGTYNYTDINRIEQWSQYIAQQLYTYGYLNLNITVKTNWIMSEFPTSLEMKRIRDNVQKLKNAFISFTQVPSNLEKMTYQKANDLEKVINELNTLINNMIASFYYSNEVYSGEV